jgi:putative nucleotidyltransferase with HDIG domain
VVCVPVYFFVNNALICLIIGLSEKISPLRVWLINFRWTIGHDLILAPLGLVVALLYAKVGWWSIFAFFAPLALARYVYKLYMDLRDAYFDSLAALASALDASDPYTRGHSDRVTEYAKKTARAMKLSEREIESIEFAGRLHDIGKIGVDRSILRKRGRLNDREYTEMQKHPVMGSEIAAKLKFMKKAEDYVAYHHERFDGSGYPKGLKGGEIPVGARILGVVDAFDAMTSDRPYRPALSVEVAVQELEKGAGQQFDASIAKVFIDLIRSGDVEVEEHKVEQSDK